MITLAIDTSTARGAVALLRDEKPVAEEPFSRKASVVAAVPAAPPSAAGTAATTPHDLFDALRRLPFKPAELNLLAVGVGPGSFTGIRAGIAAAKGLALPSSLPIKGASSFDAVALTALPKMPRDCPQLCVLCDAKRDEVYFALYDQSGRCTKECAIAPLEAIADEIHNPLWFVSSEIDRFAEPVRELFGGFATVCTEPVFPSAAAVGWLAVRRFIAAGNRGDDLLEPIYLRTPQYKKI